MKITGRAVVLSTLFMASFTSPTHAQSLMERMAKKAAQKLEQKTEDRIDRKIEKGIDQSLDGVEESVKYENKEPNSSSNSNTSEEDSQKKMEEMLKKMGISSEPVKYDDTYTFSSSMKMKIKTIKKNGKVTSEGDMVSYLSKNDKIMAYEFVSGNVDVKDNPQVKGLIILDFDNQSTLILSSDKTGIASHLPNVYNEKADEFDNEVANPNYKKTGRTKTILGYKCDEYAFSDENSQGTFWITNDYKAARSSALPSLFNRSGIDFGNASGFLMSSESTNLKSGEKSTMEVTEIDANKEVRFNTKQYQITNIGSLGK